MIQAIHIQNFQSHKNTELQLSKGVNFFIGKSDSGKTAIIRAIKWATSNKPSGDSFRSRWGGDTSVEISTEDIIRRIKSNKINCYQYKGEEYKALGQNVPADIENSFNMSDVNIQYQMDSPFLLSQSAGEVARFFNRIVNLEKIDESLKKIIGTITKTNREIAFNESELQKEQQQLEQYSWVDNAQKDFKVIETLSAEERTTRQVLVAQSELLSSIERAQNKLPKIDFKKSEKDLAIIDKLSQQHKELKNKTEAAEHLFRMIKTKTNIIYESVEKEKVLEKELHDIMPDTCPLCGQEIIQGGQDERSTTNK